MGGDIRAPAVLHSTRQIAAAELQPHRTRASGNSLLVSGMASHGHTLPGTGDVQVDTR